MAEETLVTPEYLKAASKAIIDALSPLMDELGMSVAVKKATFHGKDAMRFKVHAELLHASIAHQVENEKAKAEFEKYIVKWGGKKEWYGMTVHVLQENYTITGVNPRVRSKYKIQIQDQKTGAWRNCTIDVLKAAEKAGKLIPPEPGEPASSAEEKSLEENLPATVLRRLDGKQGDRLWLLVKKCLAPAFKELHLTTDYYAAKIGGHDLEFGITSFKIPDYIDMNDQSAIDKFLFEQNIEKHGGEKSWYGITLINPAGLFKVVGFRVNAKGNVINLRREEDGKMFVETVAFVRKHMETWKYIEPLDL